MSTTYKVSSRLPSFGAFGYEPEVSYFFGFPRSIETGGIAMDLDSVTSVIAVSDGDEAKRINRAFQLGMLSSALEHAIPEQMFSTAENPADAISAVKALQKASAAGQRVYHITNANKDTILPDVHHNSLIMSEIQDAINAGKEVITHTDSVSIQGWNGAGYILFDPGVGSGAYKIGGGKNGSFLDELPSATNASILLSVMGAGFAGYANSAIDSLPDMSQIKQHRLGQVFKSVANIVGLSAIALSLSAIAFDDSLTLSDKIGQFFVTILGAAIAELVGGAIGAAFYPGAAAAVSMIFSFILSVLLIEFVTIYFTNINRKYGPRYLAIVL